MTNVILVVALLFLFACTGPGADSGFAPGAEHVVPPSTNSTNHVKYGQTVTLGNGWQVSNDNTDPVEQKTLPNGWQIEVKYE